MDDLITQTTLEINKLMHKKKAIENDAYATKTTIKAKAKPLVEEMNVLRAQLMEY